MTKKTSTSPSLRDVCLDQIGAIAAEMQKADPTLTKQQAVVKAAQTPEGRNAYNLYRAPGSERPILEAIASLTKAEGPGTMRAAIIEKRATRKAKPMSPSDALYAQICSEAAAAFPGMPAAKQISSYLDTTEGRLIHARYNAALQQQAPAAKTMHDAILAARAKARR